MRDTLLLVRRGNYLRSTFKIKFQPATEGEEVILNALQKLLGKSKNIATTKCLVWEPLPGNEKAAEPNVDEIIDLIYDIHLNNYRNVLTFYNKYGPLFKPKSISLNEVRALITTFILIHGLFPQTDHRSAHPDIIDQYLINPIKAAQQQFPEHRGEWIASFVDLKNDTATFLPKDRVPNVPDSIFAFTAESPKKRASLSLWAKNTAISNINRIFSQKLKFNVSSVKNTPKNQFEVKSLLKTAVGPEDLFTEALLEVVNYNNKYRSCECGCGEMAPVNPWGNAWFDPKVCKNRLYHRKALKDRALSYYRVLKSRKKITPERYIEIQEIAKSYNFIEEIDVVTFWETINNKEINKGGLNNG